MNMKNKNKNWGSKE